MRLSEIRIHLCGSRPSLAPAPTPAVNGNNRFGNGHPHQGNHQPVPPGGRLRAYCSLTFDDTFVVRDVKLIEGNDGLFLAMPARKLCDHCPRCNEKNHLRARFCNHCGSRLPEGRYMRYQHGAGRLKLHADIAHPINAETRGQIEREVLSAYETELERSRQPGYVAPRVDMDYDDEPDCQPMRLRATGTA
jgi:stage V sporulation protein G